MTPRRVEGTLDAQHAAKVGRIARQLRGRRRESGPVSLRKRSVSHQVPRAVDARYSDDKIDVRDLDQILEIDPIGRTCTAESGVTFVDLVRATLRWGLVPLIVPELETITIGGAVSGCSLESASFKWGGFHDSCLEYEVITARGEVLVCTPTNENALVFQMLHGSFGTLGVLSRLRFRLAPALPLVHLRHEKYATLVDLQAAIRGHMAAGDLDFMDGIIHSPSLYVLCAGRYVESAPYTNRYDWMKVYHRSTRERDEDYLTTRDYLFRYDRGVTNVHPSSAIGRFFLGKFIDSSRLLRLANRFHWLLPAERPSVTVDLFVPFSRAASFLDWYQEELQFFPLWCVPYRRVRDYEWIADGFFQGLDDDLFLDLAIYGMRQRGDRNYYKVLEEKLLEIGGIKTLISHNFYSEEDFWRTWNRPNHLLVKARTDPDNLLRDLYVKTCKR